MTDQEKAAALGEITKKVSKGRYIDYVIDIAIYNNDQQIESLCNSIQFINTGSMAVTIKGATIVAGAGLSIVGNYGEFDVTVYEVQFPNMAANVAAGLKAELTVVRKLYSNNPGAIFQLLGPQAAYKM